MPIKNGRRAYYSLKNTNMKKDIPHDTTMLSFTAAATIMGIGFVTAFGGAVYVPLKAVPGARVCVEEGPLRGVLTQLHDVYGASAPSTPDVYPMSFTDAGAHARSLEAVLAEGDYTAWLAYVEAHPRIAEVVAEDALVRSIELEGDRWLRKLG
jgi:hypothetical protein